MRITERAEKSDIEDEDLNKQENNLQSLIKIICTPKKSCIHLGSKSNLSHSQHALHTNTCVYKSWYCMYCSNKRETNIRMIYQCDKTS